MHPTGVKPVIFGFIVVVGLNCLYCKSPTAYLFYWGFVIFRQGQNIKKSLTIHQF